MSEEIYGRLREFLDKLPGGYPATDVGIEIRILKKLFSPEDAELVMKLKPQPEELSSIAERLGIGEAEAGEKLEDLAKRGLIFRTREGDKVAYQAFQFIVGIYEFQLPYLDREFSEMMEEYFPYLGMSLGVLKTKQLRVAPVDSSVDALPTVAPYNNIREMVKKEKLILNNPCICRKEQELLGNKCDRPRDLCFSFGKFAQYGLDNGTGTQVTPEEALELLDKAEEAALVMSPSNTQELEFICCCCGCCCGGLKNLKLLDNPADFMQSYYRAIIDPDECTACGTCVERCQIDAIEEKDDVMEVNPARCIGCGLCVSECPVEAITLEEKEGMEPPPADLDEVFERLSKERGLA
jgi:electron transport complex protein RnfB